MTEDFNPILAFCAQAVQLAQDYAPYFLISTIGVLFIVIFGAILDQFKP